MAISPHLDDVVFSCGGWLYDQARAGTEVLCVTVFTASVSNPAGFALACQLDKGLPPEADYMALRRREDEDACRLLGVRPLHLAFREAPHRGYTSATALFAGVIAEDTLDAVALRGTLQALVDEHQPAEVLYPIGAGNHVDHLHVIDAVEDIRPTANRTVFRQYYDMPYARKQASKYPELGETVPATRLSEVTWRVKIAACSAYATQVGFQFGGLDEAGKVLGMAEYLTEVPVRQKVVGDV